MADFSLALAYTQGFQDVPDPNALRDECWRFDGVTDQAVANKLFDMAASMGLERSVRYVQRCVYQPVDSAWGPATEAAVNLFGDPLLDCLRRVSLQHFENIAMVDPATWGSSLPAWRLRASS